MPRRIFVWYQRRRIVNVNANIVAAGLLAMALTLIPVHFSRYITDNDLLITATALISDLIFDVVVYYGLHWVANHWHPEWLHGPRKKKRKKRRRFMRDATVIQLERVMLSPIFYLTAVGLKLTLLKHDVEREWAFLIGFGLAIAVTRVIHTVWGVWAGRFRDDHDDDDDDEDDDGRPEPDVTGLM